MSTMPGSCVFDCADLFAPLADLRAALPFPCSVERLNAYRDTLRDAPCSGNGRPIRFTASPPAPRNYEQHVFDSGEVPTRASNRHDYFNALVWMRFPQTKAALNTLHVAEIGARTNAAAGRGPLRDAATQFDESGVIVASADPRLLELLALRDWKTLFWTRRDEVRAGMRFLVFGHGLYDALRAPFYRMCGRAALVEVPQALIAAAVGEQCAHVDAMVADRFRGRVCYPRPRTLMALPLLGIPGVTRENDRASYYDDVVQFRPLPADHLDAL